MANGGSTWLARFRDGGSKSLSTPPAANDVEAPLESVGIVLDDAGDPALPCATCGGCSFHQPPGDPWRCSICEPPTLPDDAAALAGWEFCSLPPGSGDWVQGGLPGAAEGAQDAASGSGHTGVSPTTAFPGALRPPWDNDREWIRLWRIAGPTLATREPIVRAWIGAAPEQPLPRCLAALELARVARQHGLTIEVALQNGPPAPRREAQERDPASTRPGMLPTTTARSGGFSPPAPELEDDAPPDPARAPIGRCRCCRWTTPLTGRGTCWGCATEGRP
jgi:hypothetical protein